MRTTILRLGTIPGRHPMPVDGYLVGEVERGQAAYDEAFARALLLGERHRYSTLGRELEVQLYYTGLTEVTLGALDGFEAAGGGLRAVPYRYEPSTGLYEPLRRRLG